MTKLNDIEPTDKSAKRKRERKAYLRHAEEPGGINRQRGIAPGHGSLNAKWRAVCGSKRVLRLLD